MVIRRIGPVSVAKIAGVVYGFIGLLLGGVFSLASIIAAAAGTAADQPEAIIGVLFGIGAVVILPVLYGFIGFLTTLIGAGLYNLVAGIVGGIEIDV